MQGDNGSWEKTRVPSDEKAISVTQLNSYIKGSLSAEDMLSSIYLAGEASGFKVVGGHAYFTLKDANSSISCACFGYETNVSRETFKSKPFKPQEGELVLLFGGVDFYMKRGTVSFNATSVQPLGKGVLQAKFEELKARLTAEGCFSAERKKEIPPYPQKVGVITSKSGAVIRDIVTTTRKNNKIIDICVHDVRVQGQEAVPDIVKALKIADGMGYHVLIIARGGGSAEDLSPFNAEELVHAICALKTPVISAVGHETDFTLCDFAADLRVPTPTAAAEKIAFNARAELSAKIENLIRAANYAVEKKENEVNRLLQRIDANNPARILKRGYFKVLKGGREQYGVTDLGEGDEIELVAHDGRAKAWISRKV